MVTMRRMAVIEFDEDTEGSVGVGVAGVDSDGFYTIDGIERFFNERCGGAGYLSSFKVIMLTNQGEK